MIQKLDNIIKAGRQSFDITHEDRKSNENGSREMSLDIKNTCPSPVSPNSFAPQMLRLGSFSDVSKSLTPLLQAAEKCLSLNIFRTLPGESRNKKMNKRFRKFTKSKSTPERFPNKVPGSPRSVINPETEARGINEAFLPFQLPTIAPPNAPLTSANPMPTQERVPTSPSPIMSPKSVPSLQLSKSKRTDPTGPPPPPPPTVAGSNANRTAPNGPPPPPPLAAGGSRLLRLKRSDSKLKLSSHMGNLYRSLKRKLEGSNASGSTSNKVRALVGGAANAKQGMADALAELTKRYEHYFRQY